jgi:hypothetical protein
LKHSRRESGTHSLLIVKDCIYQTLQRIKSDSVTISAKLLIPVALVLTSYGATSGFPIEQIKNTSVPSGVLASRRCAKKN